MNVGLILVAAILLAISGIPALFLGSRSRLGSVVSCMLNLAAAGIGTAGLIHFALLKEGGNQLSTEWPVPVGHFAVGLDPLGLIFLVPIFLISSLGAIYGLGYWPQNRQPGNGQKLRANWGLLSASMVLVVLARDAFVFLVAWEIMALSAFMLVATQDYKQPVRRAAWVYLIATHVGTLCLLAMFALLRATTGSFDLWTSLDPSAGAPLTAILILGIIGFGTKAGLFPLHVWLPGAHSSAPSHVSAILSGVMLKMGVYGLFRVTGLLTHPPFWWGAVLLSIGGLSALLGIAYAMGQKDYKRLLAYSSIENIGIIIMGLGLALLGKAAGKSEWVVLGIGASLFHLLNHSLFKPLLFMGAGGLLHAVHTRHIDRLGGLARRMPLTFAVFLLGGIAICGLPPMNGFVSEFTLYLGLLKTTLTPKGTPWAWAALGVPVLAAVGAIAVSVFVKLVGVIFLGAPRGRDRKAHDPHGMMAVPLLVLICLCLGVGLYPLIVLPVLEPAIKEWSPSLASPTLGSLIPLSPLTWLGLSLIGGVGMALVAMSMLIKRRGSREQGTWDCGYARPTHRMQYTGSSFGQSLVDLFAWALWPRGTQPRIRRLFPRLRTFARDVPDALLDRVWIPTFNAGHRAATRLHGIQQGSVQAYLVYLLLIIVVLVLLG